VSILIIDHPRNENKTACSLLFLHRISVHSLKDFKRALLKHLHEFNKKYLRRFEPKKSNKEPLCQLLRVYCLHNEACRSIERERDAYLQIIFSNEWS